LSGQCDPEVAQKGCRYERLASRLIRRRLASTLSHTPNSDRPGVPQGNRQAGHPLHSAGASSSRKRIPDRHRRAIGSAVVSSRSPSRRVASQVSGRRCSRWRRNRLDLGCGSRTPLAGRAAVPGSRCLARRRSGRRPSSRPAFSGCPTLAPRSTNRRHRSLRRKHDELGTTASVLTGPGMRCSRLSSRGVAAIAVSALPVGAEGSVREPGWGPRPS
jgi:hypothetical protein